MNTWFALYTKSRNEKKVAEKLIEQQIEVYCPTQTILRQWSDRKKKVKVAVFPSYVFVCYTSEEERLKILQTPGVVSFVRYLGKDAKIRSEEIDAIKELLGQYTEVKVDSVERGDKVQITYGGMKGQEGEVISSTKDSVFVYIESLGLSVSAEIGKAKIKKVGEKIQKQDIKHHF